MWFYGNGFSTRKHANLLDSVIFITLSTDLAKSQQKHKMLCLLTTQNTKCCFSGPQRFNLGQPLKKAIEKF